MTAQYEQYKKVIYQQQFIRLNLCFKPMLGSSKDKLKVRYCLNHKKYWNHSSTELWFIEFNPKYIYMYTGGWKMNQFAIPNSLWSHPMFTPTTASCIQATTFNGNSM